MILSENKFISPYIARMMTYVGVMSLSKAHLTRIVEHFPTSRRYLKRSAVFLALRRCIIRAAKMHMKSGGGLDGMSELRNWSLQAAVDKLDHPRHGEAADAEAASEFAMERTHSQRMETRPAMTRQATERFSAKPIANDSLSELGAPAARSYVDSEGMSDGGFLTRSSAVCPATIAKKRSASQRDLLTNNIEMAPAAASGRGHRPALARNGCDGGREGRTSTAGRPASGSALLEKRLTEQPSTEHLDEESASGGVIMGRRSFKTAAQISKLGVLSRGGSMGSLHVDDEGRGDRKGHNGNCRTARGGGPENAVALRVESKLDALDSKVSGVDERVVGLQAMMEKLTEAVQSIDQRMGAAASRGVRGGGRGGTGEGGDGVGRLPSMMATPALHARHEGSAEESAVLTTARARRRPASSAKVTVQV